MAFIAKAIMEPTSETVAGRMSASVVLANFPNFVWRWTRASSLRTSHLPLHAGRWANSGAPRLYPSSGSDYCGGRAAVVPLISSAQPAEPTPP